jgi:hypothetical protein
MPSRGLKDDMRPDELTDEQDAPDQLTPLNPLVFDLEEEKQDELVAIIMEDYRNALEARNKTDWGTDVAGKGIDFDTKYASLVALYEGQDVQRPEDWMCGRSLKVAQAIVEMLVSRLFPAIWNEDTIRWRPVEYTDKKRVDDVNKIMHWVFVVWMKVRLQVLDMVRGTVSMGTIFTEPYWSVTKRDLGDTQQEPEINPETGEPVLDPSTGEPSYIEAKMLRVDEKPALKQYSVMDVLTQPGATDIQKEPVITRENFYYHELEQEQREGIVVNVTDKLKDAVDKTIVTKFGEEMEKAEKIQDMNAKRRSSVVECIIWRGPFDVNEDGFPEEITVRVALKEEIFLQGFATSSISRKGVRPLVQTNFLNRMYKLLGIGVLEQVKPLAEEIDAVFRQIQDANTLGIMRWGFYDPNSDYNPEEHVAKPRAMYPVTNPSQNVFFPDMNVPIERLIAAVQLLMEFVERLTAASSVVMGKEGKFAGGSGTATRTQAIVSSADARFNLPAMNIRDGIAEVLTQIFDLCFLNMPEGLEKRILGENHEPIFESTEAIKEAFYTQMDAYLEPNASFGDVNTQREIASILYDKFVLGGNPLVIGSMDRLYHATANVFKSFGEEPKEWIGPSPVSKETSDPHEEHTIIREGRVISPDPQENHLEHILVHTQMLQNPEIVTWPKEAVQLLTVHIEEHKAMMIQIMQFQQQGGDKSGGQGQEGGGADSKAEGSEGAAGKPGASGSAKPAEDTSANQTQGTTLGAGAF